MKNLQKHLQQEKYKELMEVEEHEQSHKRWKEDGDKLLSMKQLRHWIHTVL